MDDWREPRGRHGPTTSYTRMDGCGSLTHLKQLTAAVAQLHARWWGAPKAPPLDWPLDPLADFGGQVMKAYAYITTTGLDALATFWADEFAPILAWRPLIKSRLRYIHAELFRRPLTLCHGDLHLENVFFAERFEPHGASVLDFGNMTFSQALSDIAFFLSHNVTIDVRRSYEAEVLQHYYAKLLEYGLSPRDYSWAQCWRDYRFQLWRPLISLLALAPSFAKQHRARTGMFAPSPTDNDAKLLRMYTEAFNPRLVAALVDHRWDQLMLEGDESGCAVCSCMPWVTACCS